MDLLCNIKYRLFGIPNIGINTVNSVVGMLLDLNLVSEIFFNRSRIFPLNIHSTMIAQILLPICLILDLSE